jgi:hypothetical protein
MDSSLFDFLDQDSICEVIRQVGQPIQFKDLRLLLNIAKDPRDKVALCITEIDFTDGQPLTQDYQFNESAKSYSKIVDKTYLERFTRLREYRIVHQPGKIVKIDDVSKYLIGDPRARYLAVRLPFLQNITGISELIRDGLAVRFKKYGPKFTFQISLPHPYSISYSDGALITKWKPLGIAASVTKLLLEVIPSQYLIGFGQLEDMRVDVGIRKKIANGQLPNLKKLIFYSKEAFGSYDDFDYVVDLLPHLTEILFRDTHKYPKPFGVLDWSGSDVSSYLRRNGNAILVRDYLDVLLNNLLTEADNGVAYPNIIKFEIPVPQALTPTLKRLFPNVKQFNIVEDYAERYLRQMFIKMERVEEFENSSVYQRLQAMRHYTIPGAQ